MIFITPSIAINEAELEFSFIRSPGPGGQNVNKVASAVQLRFDALNSPSLPEEVRARLQVLAGSRMTRHGELLIRAVRFRTQERNRQDAIERLVDLLKRAAVAPRKRKKTRPTAASRERRLSVKKIHGRMKSLRRKQGHQDEC